MIFITRERSPQPARARANPARKGLLYPKKRAAEAAPDGLEKTVPIRPDPSFFGINKSDNYAVINPQSPGNYVVRRFIGNRYVPVKSGNCVLVSVVYPH